VSAAAHRKVFFGTRWKSVNVDTANRQLPDRFGDDADIKIRQDFRQLNYCPRLLGKEEVRVPVKHPAAWFE